MPPLFKTALVWGLFMGVSSNLRYQVRVAWDISVHRTHHAHTHQHAHTHTHVSERVESHTHVSERGRKSWISVWTAGCSRHVPYVWYGTYQSMFYTHTDKHTRQTAGL